MEHRKKLLCRKLCYCWCGAICLLEYTNMEVVVSKVGVDKKSDRGIAVSTRPMCRRCCLSVSLLCLFVFVAIVGLPVSVVFVVCAVYSVQRVWYAKCAYERGCVRVMCMLCGGVWWCVVVVGLLRAVPLAVTEDTEVRRETSARARQAPRAAH